MIVGEDGSILAFLSPASSSSSSSSSSISHPPPQTHLYISPGIITNTNNTNNVNDNSNINESVQEGEHNDEVATKTTGNKKRKVVNTRSKKAVAAPAPSPAPSPSSSQTTSQATTTATTIAVPAINYHEPAALFRYVSSFVSVRFVFVSFRFMVRLRFVSFWFVLVDSLCLCSLALTKFGFWEPMQHHHLHQQHYPHPHHHTQLLLHNWC